MPISWKSDACLFLVTGSGVWMVSKHIRNLAVCSSFRLYPHFSFGKWGLRAKAFYGSGGWTSMGQHFVGVRLSRDRVLIHSYLPKFVCYSHDRMDRKTYAICHHELHEGALRELAVLVTPTQACCSPQHQSLQGPFHVWTTAKVGMLLTEPDSKIKLAAGFGRHWPDARGVFVCDAWWNTPLLVALLAAVWGWGRWKM